LNFKFLFRDFAGVEQKVFGGSVSDQEPVADLPDLAMNLTPSNTLI